jgi:hypothetical protein
MHFLFARQLSMARRLALAVVAASLSSALCYPVIFDTDIGTDFDDSAAIALALADPEMDVRLIVRDSSRPLSPLPCA